MAKKLDMLTLLRNIVGRPSIHIVTDGAAWSLDEDAHVLATILGELGYSVSVSCEAPEKGLVFFTSRYAALEKLKKVHRKKLTVAFPYYHGYPDGSEPSFDSCYEQFCELHQHIAGVQVTHEKMKACLLASGIAPQKISTIPIGINSATFCIPSLEERKAARAQFAIPENALVVGSFQKDGNGWEEGNTPKTIKGPDTLLQTLVLLKQRIPQLFVLLSGPARGYVKQGLLAHNIPFSHEFAQKHSDLASYYHAIDAYLVTSRQEGGPKAILESMASGVAIISTRVGQAVDIVNHGVNGWLADVEDAEALAAYTEQALLMPDAEKTKIQMAARKCAEKHDHMQQLPLWKNFFENFR